MLDLIETDSRYNHRPLRGLLISLTDLFLGSPTLHPRLHADAGSAGWESGGKPPFLTAGVPRCVSSFKLVWPKLKYKVIKRSERIDL
jgi:hypothetical protein